MCVWVGKALCRRDALQAEPWRAVKTHGQPGPGLPLPTALTGSMKHHGLCLYPGRKHETHRTSSWSCRTRSALFHFVTGTLSPSGGTSAPRATLAFCHTRIPSGINGEWAYGGEAAGDSSPHLRGLQGWGGPWSLFCHPQNAISCCDAVANLVTLDIFLKAPSPAAKRSKGSLRFH